MRVLFLCLRIACTLACTPRPERGLMFKQLAATADPNKLHAVIEELAVPEYPYSYDASDDVLRSVQVTVDLSAGTLALGHLVSGDVGDVGLHMVPVTSKYSFSMNDKTGVASVIEIGSSTTVASFDDAVGSDVAWFVSEALGLVYLVSGGKRVLMAPLGLRPPSPSPHSNPNPSPNPSPITPTLTLNQVAAPTAAPQLAASGTTRGLTAPRWWTMRSR